MADCYMQGNQLLKKQTEQSVTTAEDRARAESKTVFHAMDKHFNKTCWIFGQTEKHSFLFYDHDPDSRITALNFKNRFERI